MTVYWKKCNYSHSYEYVRGDHSTEIILKVKNNSLLASFIIISLVANEEKNICEIKHEKSNGRNKKKRLSVYKFLYFSLPHSHTNEFHLGFVPFSSNLHIAATARLRLNRAADRWLVMCVRGRKTEWKREKEAKDNDINETLPWDINGIFFSAWKSTAT